MHCRVQKRSIFCVHWSCLFSEMIPWTLSLYCGNNALMLKYYIYVWISLREISTTPFLFTPHRQVRGQGQHRNSTPGTKCTCTIHRDWRQPHGTKGRAGRELLQFQTCCDSFASAESPALTSWMSMCVKHQAIKKFSSTQCIWSQHNPHPSASLSEYRTVYSRLFNCKLNVCRQKKKRLLNAFWLKCNNITCFFFLLSVNVTAQSRPCHVSERGSTSWSWDINKDKGFMPQVCLMCPADLN